MMFGLAEANGDEPAARYLYDRVWKERQDIDYEADSLERFLLNHGRSYAFNFQNRVERARTIEVSIAQVPFGEAPNELREYLTNSAKFNLRHARNTSPETVGLIGLVQTYNANPVLFKDFPKHLTAQFRRQPTPPNGPMSSTIIPFTPWCTEISEVMAYLDHAIQEMDQDYDEPRVCQLLGRRAMLNFRHSDPALRASAMEDATRARALAEKYHEPHLLALSALALAIGARKLNGFAEAFRWIRETVKKYDDLKRIPQYVESTIEYLKILLILLCHDDPGLDLVRPSRLTDQMQKRLMLGRNPSRRNNRRHWLDALAFAGHQQAVQ